MKKHYELIRPLEEETVSMHVITFYEELCEKSTMPWALFDCGVAIGSWVAERSRDYVFYDYIFRISRNISDALAENADYNINMK